MSNPSTTTHTPGPWIFDGNNRVLGLETADEQPVIAEVYGAAVRDQDGHANALLIAAAPELLEALEELLGVAADPLCHSHGTALKVARYAIAKAKGSCET